MVAPYIVDKFDIGVLRQDGSTKVGLMLRRGRNELPQWALYEDEYLATQYFSGEPGYGALPAEKELAIRQDDWRSGLGLETYDANDPKRYHKATMDMRFRGKGIAGWKSTAVTLPSTVSGMALVDGDLENWTGADLDSWTEAFNNTTLSEKAGESGSAARFTSSNANATGSCAQVVATWTNDLRGKVIRAKCRVKGNAGSNVIAYISIGDGIGTTTESVDKSTDATFTTIEATRTINAGATALTITFGVSELDAGLTCDFDTIELSLPTAGAIIDSKEFNDNLYIASGNILSKLNTTTGTSFDFIRTFYATITSLEVMQIGGVDYLFIALGLSDQYWYMIADETFTESTAAVTDFKYFVVVNAAAPTMWGTDGVNTIRSTVNPLNGGTAWSGQTTVAMAYHEITGLKTDGASLFIPKENRPYYLNSAGAVQSDLAPELEALTKSTSNGKNATFWLGNFYLPWGDQSLLEYDAGTNTWRSPALQSTNAAEYNGQVFAVCGDDQFLFAILDYSTKIEVLAGRLEVIDSTTQWVWHSINETTLAGCNTAFISSVYQKRLWIASTSSGDSLYYIPLPTGYADVANDANRSFQTGTTMETPWLHGNFKSTVKAFPELELVMGHTYNAGRYFTVKYKKIGDSSWTTIGNYTGTATSMTQSKYIPADATPTNPKSTLFKLQFTAVTNDTTITPILNNYYLKGVLYPDRRQIILAKVYCANEIQLKDGTLDQGSYATIIATLDEAREATWPVTIYDINGDTKTVKLLPLPSNIPWYRVIGNEKERKLELEFNLLMQIVSLS